MADNDQVNVSLVVLTVGWLALAIEALDRRLLKKDVPHDDGVFCVWFEVL